MHKKPDSEDNSLGNLQWGTTEQNREERHRRYSGRCPDSEPVDALEVARRVNGEARDVDDSFLDT
jgi:hypothetical protein